MLISEEEYFEFLDQLPPENRMLEDSDPDKFIAKMGAEGLNDLLTNLDLDQTSYELRHRANNETSQQRRNDILKDCTFLKHLEIVVEEQRINRNG